MSVEKRKLVLSLGEVNERYVTVNCKMFDSPNDLELDVPGIAQKSPDKSFEQCYEEAATMAIRLAKMQLSALILTSN